MHFVYDLDKFFLMVQPILFCKKHRIESLIYLWNKLEQKLYYRANDLIINKKKFWTIPRFDSKVQNRSSINQRRHFTNRCLQGFWTEALQSTFIFNLK